MKKIVHVVPHSHWDREWYFTLQDSSVILDENMHGLIRALNTNPEFEYYVFDGQYSVIEDFIRWNPEQMPNIEKLVREKRLFIGPWYTQCDTRIPSIESVIRNLQYGIQQSKKIGHSQNIGYLPDVFGQHAYLPAIFKDLRIEFAVLQRGIYDKQLKDKNVNFYWSAPNDVCIPTNNLYFGYGPGKFLCDDELYFKQQLDPILQKLSVLNADCEHLLLPAGGDQVYIREQFPEVIESLNDKQHDYTFVLSNYENFMAKAWDNVSFDNVIEGELVATENSRIHRTIVSQRMDIKQQNAEVESMILEQLEPLLVYTNDTYPHRLLEEVWRLLFDVHAHDSIGGCNSDDTNRDIISRIKQARELVAGMINVQKRKLASRIITQSDGSFYIFNSTVMAVNNNLELTLYTPYPSFAIKTSIGACRNFTVLNQNKITGGKSVLLTVDGEKEIVNPDYYETKILLSDVNIKGLQHQLFYLEERLEEKMRFLELTRTTSIQNEFYTIVVDDGSMKLCFGEQCINNFIQFENMADAGDSYDFAYLESVETTRINEKYQLLEAKQSEHLQIMRVSCMVAAAENLVAYEKNKISCEVEIITTLKLYQGDRTIHIEHEIANQVYDHRVRVKLETEKFKNIYKKSGFGLTEVVGEPEVLKNWKVEKFAEAPLPVYVLDDVVYAENAQYDLTVMSKTIKEFAIENQCCFLTLFRSVGLLGRDDLSTRPGRASGINNKEVLTPDAQMQQTLHFTYGLNYFAQRADITMELRKYFGTFQYYQQQQLNSYHQRLDRFELPAYSEKKDLNQIFIPNERLLQTVLQRNLDGTIIIRFANLSEVLETIMKIPGYEMRQVNLLGEIIREAEIFEVKPNDYITLALKKESKNEKEN